MYDTNSFKRIAFGIFSSHLCTKVAINLYIYKPVCYLTFSYWIVVIDNWHYKLIKCKEKGNEEFYDPNVNSVEYQGLRIRGGLSMKEAVARSVYYFRNRGHGVCTLSGIPHHIAPIFRMRAERIP